MRSRRNKNDTLYHVLFWIVVVVLFPVSLSVWFYRSNPLNLSDNAKKLALGVVWAAIAAIVVLIIVIPDAKNNSDDLAASEKASVEASKNASIAESEEEARRQSEEEAKKSKMEITFYDMGQADAILITCEGHCMLIDSGELSSTLSAKVLEKDISQMDYVVVSTPQNESVGGLARALNHIDVDTVFCPVNGYDSEKFLAFMSVLESRGKTLTVPKAGDSYALGSAKITFLGPVTTPDSVETSLVLKITHQGQSFLFTGFADAEQLTAIANTGADLSADILKVGRHGRDGCLSEALLKIIDPSVAVISAGAGYGCPSENTLQLLKNADVTLYRTDLQGNIDMVSSLGDVKITVDEDGDVDTYEGIAKQTEPATEATEAASTEAAAEDPGIVFETGEATPNAAGWRYGRVLSDMQFHRLNCPKLNVPDDEKEYYDNLRDELYGWGFEDCEICHPMN